MVTAKRIGWTALILIALGILWSLGRNWGIKLDFANFYDAGQKARAGQVADLYNPNALIAGQEPLGHMTFFSAPLTSYFYLPLAALKPVSALLAFKLAGTAALVAALVLLFRRLRVLAGPAAAERSAYFALFAVATLLFQPFWTIYFVGGQTTPFVFLFFVLTFDALVRGRSAMAALWCTLAVLIKPVFAPAAILIFLLSDGPFRWTALVLGGGSIALSLALFGMEPHREFLTLVAGETRRLQTPLQNSALLSFIEPWVVDTALYASPSTVPPGPHRAEALLRALAAAALLFGLYRLLRQGLERPARIFVIWSAGLLLSLVLSAVVWAHYLAVIFPAIAALLALRRYLSQRARILLGATLVLCLFQSRFLVMNLEALLGAPDWTALAMIGFLKSLPLVLFLLLLIADRRGIAAAARSAAWREVAG